MRAGAELKGPFDRRTGSAPREAHLAVFPGLTHYHILQSPQLAAVTGELLGWGGAAYRRRAARTDRARGAGPVGSVPPGLHRPPAHPGQGGAFGSLWVP